MLRRRFSRKAPLVAFIAVLAVMGAQTATAEETPVFLRFAGDFIQGLEQTDVDVTGVPLGTSNLGLVRAQAKGNLGRAELTGVSKAADVFPAPDSRCPDGFVKVADITDNSLVFTFSDLSLLYGDGQGVVCVNFATGQQYAAIDGMWFGGTGRFQSAEGEFSIRFDEFALVNPNTRIIAEAGTITGTLIRGH